MLLYKEYLQYLELSFAVKKTEGDRINTFITQYCYCTPNHYFLLNLCSAGEKYHLLVEGYGLAAVMGAAGIDGTRTKSNHIIEVSIEIFEYMHA